MHLKIRGPHYGRALTPSQPRMGEALRWVTNL